MQTPGDASDHKTLILKTLSAETEQPANPSLRMRRGAWHAVGCWLDRIYILLVVISLLGCSLADWANVFDVEATDVYDMPPGPLLLQRAFYHGKPNVTSGKEDTSAFGDIFSLDEATVEKDERATVAGLCASPSRTANVGVAYRNNVCIEGISPDALYELERVPAGMSMDAGGVVTWVPEDDQLGSHPIRIVARQPDGKYVRVEYELSVSSKAHFLGTDRSGRDIVGLLISGAKWAFFPAFLTAMAAIVLGVSLGAWGSYYSGHGAKTVQQIERLVDSFPALILLIMAAALSGYNLHAVLLVLGTILFPTVAKEVRSVVAEMRSMQYIDASREMGRTNWEILWVDIIWFGMRYQLAARFFSLMGVAVAMEATLSYLRLGAQYPEVSWGNMIFDGRQYLGREQYVLFLMPTLCIVLTVFAYSRLSSLLLRSGVVLRSA